jgi:myosin heavy subunit
MQTQLSKKLEDQAFTSKQKYKAKLITKLQSALEEQRSESNGELQKLQQEYEHHIA